MRLEDALPPGHRAALLRYLTDVGISPKGWEDVNWLRLWAEPLAVEAEADRIQAAEAVSRERAVLGACVRLNVSHDAYTRRMRAVRANSRAEKISGENLLSTPAPPRASSRA